MTDSKVYREAIFLIQFSAFISTQRYIHISLTETTSTSVVFLDLFLYFGNDSDLKANHFALRKSLIPLPDFEFQTLHNSLQVPQFSLSMSLLFAVISS
jgi:hypothetical protein